MPLDNDNTPTGATDGPASPFLDESAARQRAVNEVGRRFTHGAHIPETDRLVSSKEEAESLPAGATFVAPDGTKHVVPYKVQELEDLRTVPEGAEFVGPDGILRTNPKYEDVGFTTNTLYDMAANDKERRNALKREGTVKEDPLGQLYVEDEQGKRRKPRGFKEAPGSYITSQAAPVVGSIGGGIAGGVAGARWNRRASFQRYHFTAIRCLRPFRYAGSRRIGFGRRIGWFG